MRILALDTTTELATISLADEQGIAALLSFRQKRDISRRWPLRVQAVLAEAGWELSALQGIGVCSGPGSFTGLRIGVVAAKTLAQALGLPVVAVSSLELMALPFVAATGEAVTAVLPCRRGEVYAGRFGPGGDGASGVDLVSQGMSVKGTQSLLEEASKPGFGLLVGDVGKDPLSPLPARYLHRPWPDVERLPLETVRRLQAGRGEDPLRVLPLYLKRSQAEEALDAIPQLANLSPPSHQDTKRTQR